MNDRKSDIWTVIGAGMGGKGLLGQLGASGVRVRACDKVEAQVAGIRAVGGLHVEGKTPRDFAPVELATTDLRAAVDGASVLIVYTYGGDHAEVARQLAPLLVDGQTIVLIQGNFGGALIFRAALKAAGCKATVDVAEMDASPYGVKVMAPDRVHLSGKKESWQMAALPTSRGSAVAARIGHAFPGMVVAPTVLHTGFVDLGGIFHVGGIITNVGRVEGPDPYNFYAANMVPSVCNLLEALDAERLAVAKAYGVDLVPASVWLARTYNLQPNSLHENLKVMSQTRYLNAPAPKSLTHRYLVQDVGCALVPTSELGRVAKVPTPASDGAIAIANALTGRDFRREGRNLHALGLDGLSLAEIIKITGC
jgi:opine dehydrogenase